MKDLSDKEQQEKIQMLYQQYRDGDAGFEQQIRTILDFAIQHTSSSRSRDETSASVFENLFADVEQELSTQEKRVLSFYRDFQKERGAEGNATAMPNAVADPQIDRVLAACQPLLDARSSRFDAQRETDSTDSIQSQSLWSKLVDRFTSYRSLPLGALASVALAVVAVAVLLNTQSPDPLVELTGVSSYESSIVTPISDNLVAPTIASMGFSPTDNDSTVAYAIGSLFGELAISIAGNNKDRALQTLKRMDVISRSSPDYGDRSAIDGQATLTAMSDALIRTQEDISASDAPDLLDDKAVIEGLEAILMAFNDASRPEELTAFQKLGSWTLVTLTLIEANKVDTSTATRAKIVDRLIADAEPIVADVQKQVGLSDAQRGAVADFNEFAKTYRSNESQQSSLAALKDITEKIDTTFRI